MRYLLCLALLTVLACTPTDVTHDGTIRVACLGDSNTDAGWDGRGARWCEYAATLCPAYTFENYAVAGATAATDGPVQLDHALTSGADSIVLLLGSNDLIFHNGTPTSITASLRSLCMTAANASVHCNVLTLPPNIGKDVAPTNAAIIAKAPVYMRADGNTGMVLGADGLHLDDASERLLGARVALLLNCPTLNAKRRTP